MITIILGLIRHITYSSGSSTGAICSCSCKSLISCSFQILRFTCQQPRPNVVAGISWKYEIFNSLVHIRWAVKNLQVGTSLRPWFYPYPLRLLECSLSIQLFWVAVVVSSFWQWISGCCGGFAWRCRANVVAHKFASTFGHLVATLLLFLFGLQWFLFAGRNHNQLSLSQQQQNWET